MVAQAPDGRTGRVAGAAVVAVALGGLTLLLEPPSWRPLAAVLLAAGLAVGVVAAMRLPASGRSHTAMERLNDGAFLVVVAVVALIAVRLARPWTAALPGPLARGALAPPPPPPPPPPAGRAPPAAPPPADPGAPDSGG